MDRYTMSQLYLLTKHCIEQDAYLEHFLGSNPVYAKDDYKNHTGLILIQIGIDLCSPDFFNKDEEKKKKYLELAKLFEDL
jgi:hypothetical protein